MKTVNDEAGRGHSRDGVYDIDNHGHHCIDSIVAKVVAFGGTDV